MQPKVESTVSIVIIIVYIENPVIVIVRIIDVVPGICIMVQWYIEQWRSSLDSSQLTWDHRRQCPGWGLCLHWWPPAGWRPVGGRSTTTWWSGTDLKYKYCKLSLTWRSSCGLLQDWSIQEELRIRTKSCSCSIFSWSSVSFIIFFNVKWNPRI